MTEAPDVNKLGCDKSADRPSKRVVRILCVAKYLTLGSPGVSWPYQQHVRWRRGRYGCPKSREIEFPWRSKIRPASAVLLRPHPILGTASYYLQRCVVSSVRLLGRRVVAALSFSPKLDFRSPCRCPCGARQCLLLRRLSRGHSVPAVVPRRSLAALAVDIVVAGDALCGPDSKLLDKRRDLPSHSLIQKTSGSRIPLKRIKAV